ncbi:MAG: GNAT family N-acetyltransferase [Ignavibacteria bacterium]|nr:GNAT family N-acetyltransferase [Ignavibacteria bacterium]
MITPKYNIRIEKYDAAKQSEWDNFVAESNNGTMFHLQSFLQYHPAERFEFSNYMFYDGTELVAVLPGGYKENGRVYWSPVGASYGSLVTGDIHFDLSLAVVDAMLEMFRSNGTEELFLIPPPFIYNTKYSQNIEYAMLYRKFDFEYHYISHSLELAEDNTQYYNRATKFKFNKIHKNKDLLVEINNDYENFYPILVKNKLKHNATPTHSLEELYRLDALLPNRLQLFMCYYKDEPIGGHLLFLPNANVSLCFYNAMYYEYDKQFPAYALAEKVIEWSKAHNYRWFDFGVSQDTTSDDPMAPSISLIQFKESLHTRGIFRSTYHLSL